MQEETWEIGFFWAGLDASPEAGLGQTPTFLLGCWGGGGGAKGLVTLLCNRRLLGLKLNLEDARRLQRSLDPTFEHCRTAAKTKRPPSFDCGLCAVSVCAVSSLKFLAR